MVRPADRVEPTAEALAAWQQGARTVTQARGETGLSRDELFDLMARGLVRYKVHGGRRTRLLSWADLVKHLASLPNG